MPTLLVSSYNPLSAVDPIRKECILKYYACKAPMSGTVEKIAHNNITKITFGMTGAHPVANKIHPEVLPLFYVAVCSNKKMLPGFTVHLILSKVDSGPLDCDEGIWIYVLFPFTCTLSPKNNPNRNETLDYGAIWMILFRNSLIDAPLSCAWMQMRTLVLCEGQEVNGVLCNRRRLAHFFQSRKTLTEVFFVIAGETFFGCCKHLL